MNDKLKALEAARKAPRPKPIKYRSYVDAMCRHCIYDPLSGLGTWRQQVEGCTVKDCPLWPIRATSKPRSSRGAQGTGEEHIPLKNTAELCANEDKS